MLKKVTIDKLFMREDISIDFSKNSVIITGDNGNGKTTILNIVYNSLVGDINKLFLSQFETILLQFDDNFTFVKELMITKEENKLSFEYKLRKDRVTIGLEALDNNKARIKIETESNRKNILEKEIEIETNNSILLILENFGLSSIIDDLAKINKSLLYFPTYRRIDMDVDSYYFSLFEAPLRDILKFEKARNLSQFGKYDRRVIGMSNSDIESILKEYTREINEVSSNKLDVLLHSFTRKTIEGVENTSLKNIQISQIFESANISEKLEEINHQLNLNIDPETITNISQQYESNRKLLQTLLSKKSKNIKMDEGPNMVNAVFSLPLMQIILNLNDAYSNFDKEMSGILSSYEYISENIKDFSGNKLILEKNELNEFKFKKIGTDIEKFSTGEKQLITFLVYSAIELPTDTPALVIIDEPELSLHVKWQNKLIRNILKKNNIKIFSATHSPYIINRKEVDSFIYRKVEM